MNRVIPAWRTGLIAGGILVLLIFPFLVTGFWARVATNVFMYATLATATNIIAGFTGYAAFGNVVFFGVGAYATALLMLSGMAFIPAAIIGGLICGAYAIVAGYPLLRLKGHYFAIATLGLNEMTKAIVLNLNFTGGGRGLVVPLPTISAVTVSVYFYFVMFVLMCGAVAAAMLIMRTKFGVGCRAIRSDETAAAVMGINTTFYKVAAWSVSAFIMGMTGGAYAYWFAYIDPVGSFDMLISVKIFVMILLGGIGTIAGPVLGAIFVETVSTIVWSKMLTFHVGSLGIIIMIVVILMPSGFAAFIKRGRFSMRALFESVQQSRIR